MTIGERIKAVRKQVGLTQAEFAERIGLKPTAVLMYEKGSRNVTEQSITLMVQAFNINEDWLRTEEGDMFRADNGTIIAKLAEQYNLDAAQEALIRSFLSLSNAQRDAIVAAVCSAAKEIQQTDEPGSDVERTEMDERAAAHALLDEELDARKKDASASASTGSEKRA